MEKTIAGIQGDNYIYFYTIDDSVNIVDEKRVESEGLRNHKNIACITDEGKPLIVLLSTIKSEDKKRFCIHSRNLEEVVAEFDVPEDAFIDSFSADQKHVYGWDSNSKRLFKWDSKGRIIDLLNIEDSIANSIPLKTDMKDVLHKIDKTGFFMNPQNGAIYCWDSSTSKVFHWSSKGHLIDTIELDDLLAKKDEEKLLIAYSRGKVMHGDEKLLNLPYRINKMVAYQDRIIVLTHLRGDGSFKPMPSYVLSLDSLEQDERSTFSDMKFCDAALFNGFLYLARDWHVSQHSPDKTDLRKSIGFTKGPIAGGVTALYPAKVGKKNILFYLTKYEGLCYTDADFHKDPGFKLRYPDLHCSSEEEKKHYSRLKDKEEKLEVLEKRHLKSIVIF